MGREDEQQQSQVDVSPRIAVAAAGAAACLVVATVYLWPGSHDRGELSETGGLILHYRIERPEKLERERRLLRQRMVGLTDTPDAEIRRDGERGLTIRFPGLHDPARRRHVLDTLGYPAPVRFRLVDASGAGEFFEGLEEDLPGSRFSIRELRDGTPTLTHPRRWRLAQFLEGRVDEDHTIGFEFVAGGSDAGTRETSRADGPYWRTYFLFETVHFSGDDLASVSLQRDDRTGEPTVRLVFEPSAGEAFAEFSRRHVGERVVVMARSEVQFAPVIQQPIQGGSLELVVGPTESGTSAREEARELVRLFRGAIEPSSLTYLGHDYVPRAAARGE